MPTLSNSRASRSFPRISRHLPMRMSSLHLTKMCTMPSQVWHRGARVSRPHPTDEEDLQPGRQRRSRKRQCGTLGDAVDGETGRFHVTQDGGKPGKAASRGQGGWRSIRMAPGVTMRHLYLRLGELRGIDRVCILLRRATPRNPREPRGKRRF